MQNGKLPEMYFQSLTLQKIQLAIALTLYFGKVNNTQYLLSGIFSNLKFLKISSSLVSSSSNFFTWTILSGFPMAICVSSSLSTDELTPMAFSDL